MRKLLALLMLVGCDAAVLSAKSAAVVTREGRCECGGYLVGFWDGCGGDPALPRSTAGGELEYFGWYVPELNGGTAVCEAYSIDREHHEIACTLGAAEADPRCKHECLRAMGADAPFVACVVAARARGCQLLDVNIGSAQGDFHARCRPAK